MLPTPPPWFVSGCCVSSAGAFFSLFCVLKFFKKRSPRFVLPRHTPGFAGARHKNLIQQFLVFFPDSLFHRKRLNVNILSDDAFGELPLAEKSC